jgi:hypothetical protein
MKMSKEKSIIESLAKQVQEINAGEAHMEFGGVLGNPNLTAVISVYDRQNPSNKVLDRVYEWAEDNNQQVVELIEALSKAKLD